MKTLRCRQIEGLLIVSEDRAMRADESVLVEEHLAVCAACRALAALLTRQTDTLQSVFRRESAPPLSTGVIAARALSQWDAEQRARSLFSRRENRRRALGIGGLSGAVACASVAALITISHRETMPRPVPGQAKVMLSIKGAIPLPRHRTLSARTSATPQPTLVLRTMATTAYPASPPSLRRIVPVPVRQTVAVKPSIEISAVLPLAATPDDLVVINATPAATLNDRAQAVPDEAAALEARVRASIRQGDDFVHVPFPRVASREDRAIVAAAITDFRREAAIVDPQLQKNVSLAAKGMSFADLCDRIRVQTGVDLNADASVADDKATVFCTQRSLRDLMRQISRLFGFTWRRETASGVGYRYTLTQELSAQLAEEDLRNRDRNAALAALDTNMQAYRPYLYLSPDEAFREGVSEVVQLRDLGKAWGNIPPEDEEKLRRFDNVCGPGWGAIHLYFQLTPEQRAALGRRETLAFQPAHTPDALSNADAFPLPDTFRASMLESLAGTSVSVDGNKSKGWSISFRSIPRSLPVGGEQKLVESHGDRIEKGAVSLREWDKTHPHILSCDMHIEQTEIGTFHLVASTSFAEAAGGDGGGSGAIESVAEGTSPSVRSPDNAKQNLTSLTPATLTAIQNAAPIQMTPPIPSPSAQPAGKSLVHEPQITRADALEALHKATGLDIVADSFTRTYPPAIAALPGKTSLYDGVSELADKLGLRWRAEAFNGKVDWLTFRDAGFFNDRPKEVPARLLQRWAEDRRAAGYLPLDDLREIARLSDAQLDSANNEAGATTLYGLAEWGLVAREIPRPLLRFVESLSPAHQDALWSASGLLISDLTPEEKQQMMKNAGWYGDKATRIYGQYQTIPQTQRNSVELGSHAEQYQGATLYLDFRQDDKPYRIGMGSFGG